MRNHTLFSNRRLLHLQTNLSIQIALSNNSTEPKSKCNKVKRGPHMGWFSKWRRSRRRSGPLFLPGSVVSFFYGGPVSSPLRRESAQADGNSSSLHSRLSRGHYWQGKEPLNACWLAAVLSLSLAPGNWFASMESVGLSLAASLQRWAWPSSYGSNSGALYSGGLPPLLQHTLRRFRLRR